MQIMNVKPSSTYTWTQVFSGWWRKYFWNTEQKWDGYNLKYSCNKAVTDLDADYILKDFVQEH